MVGGIERSSFTLSALDPPFQRWAQLKKEFSTFKRDERYFREYLKVLSHGDDGLGQSDKYYDLVVRAPRDGTDTRGDDPYHLCLPLC